MRGLLGLVKDTIDKLEADSLLAGYMGGTTTVYTERPADSAGLPYLVLDVIDAGQFNDQSHRGTRYTIQVSAFFQRGEQGSMRGLLDVGKACERIRDVLDDVDQYALPESPAEGESLNLDILDGRYESNTGAAHLVLRQYTTGLITADPSGLFINGICRFVCLVSE